MFGEKKDLQRKKYKLFLEIITCDPSIYTMDHPDLTVSIFIGNSIGTQTVKNIKKTNCHGAIKMDFSNISTKAYFGGTQKNQLNEMVLLST